MGLTLTVGGARGTFEDGLAAEVAGVLDHAFGSENDWEGIAPRHFGEPSESAWRTLRDRASAELGPEGVAHLLAVDHDGRGVYLPTHVQAVSFPLSAGGSLRCASLPGLRNELTELSERWSLPPGRCRARRDSPARDRRRNRPWSRPRDSGVRPAGPWPSTRRPVATVRSGCSSAKVGGTRSVIPGHRGSGILDR